MIDFNLNLIENGDGVLVHANVGDLGGGYRFPSPKDKAFLERVLIKADQVLESRGGESELVTLGKKLFDHFFQGQIRDLYQQACVRSENAQEGPLLILVRTDPGSNLQEIPWEILHDGHRVLSRDPRTSVVRYFELPLPVDDLKVQPPLRVLVTTANPSDMHSLALDKEIDSIRLAYEKAGPVLDLQVEEKICLERLEEVFRRASTHGQPFHVWHHCGHGGRKELRGKKEFRLYFEKDGVREPVEVERLQEVVAHCPQLRLAIFNVCRASSSLGLVPALARLRVPVVIGFKHPVNDRSALRFAAALHEGLLHVPVEFAANQARRAMKINAPEALDWNHAVVFSRRRDRGGFFALQTNKEKSGPSPEPPRKKSGRSSVGIDMKIGKVKAREFDAIGRQDIGNVSAGPEQNTRIRMSTDEVEAERVRQIGYQLIEGFSASEIQKREERLVDLVAKVDRYVEGA